MRKLIIPVILFIMLAIGVCGDSNLMSWWGGGNSGLNTLFNSYNGYSCDYPNDYGKLETNAWSYCDLPASDFEPISYDVNGDDFSEIIIGQTQTIYVYNRDCELLSSIVLQEALNQGSPGLDNPDQDADINMFVGGNKGVWDYEYDTALNTFVLRNNMTNNSVPGGVFTTCPWVSDICILSGANAQRALYYIDTHTGKVKNTSILNFYNTGYGVNYGQNEGLTFYRKESVAGVYTACTGIAGFFGFKCYTEPTPASYIVPVLMLTGTQTGLNLLTWNSQETTFTDSVSVPVLIGSGAALYDRINSINSFLAKTGTSLRLYSSLMYHEDTGTPEDYFHALVISNGVTGEQLWNNTINGTANRWLSDSHISSRAFSNWAVGDFNKDGTKESCYLGASKWNLTDIQAVSFKCLDSAFDEIIDFEVTGVMDVNNIVMADYDKNNTYLCLGTFEGIFCYNSTSGDIENYYPSGYTGQSITGHATAYNDGIDGIAPLLIYSDSTRSFLIRANVDFFTFTCGDGICQDTENAFSCSHDCNISITPGGGSETYSNGTAPPGTWVGLGDTAPCASGYAEYGKCALKPGGRTCTLNSECLSNECVNGKCNAPGAWAGINQFITGSFGDDTTSLTFISVFIILVLSAGIIFISRGSLAGVLASVGTMVMLMIFFTIVGWLPAFFIVGLVLLVIVTIGFLLVIKG